MRKLKFILNNILSNPILYIFIVIELVIAVVYINKLFMTLEFKDRAYKIVEKSTSKGEVLALNLYPDYFGKGDGSLEHTIQEILDYIKSKEEVSFMGKIMVVDSGTVDLKVDYDEYIKEDYFYQHIFKDENGEPMVDDYDSLKYFKMDYDYFKSFPVKVEEGETFTKEMEGIEENYYPIIAGYNFKEFYKVGDVIYDESHDLNFKIIGFAEENEIVKYGMNYENVNNCLDDSFIVLMTKKPREENSLFNLSYNNGLVFGVKEGENSTDLIKDTIKYANDKELKIAFATWKTQEVIFKEAINKSVNIVVVKSSIIAILAILGLLSTIIYCIKNMMRNIGVLTVIGAKKKNIIEIVYGQVLMLYIISYAIGFVLSKQIKFVSFFFVPNFDFITIIKGFIVILICVIIAITIPTIYLLKLQPINLVGVFKE